MRKTIFIVIILLKCALLTNAQNNIGFYLKKFDNKQINNFDIENNYYYLLRKNPSFIHYQNISDSSAYKNIIVLDMFYNDTKGLYNFYDGNKHSGVKILGGGENNIKNLGTLSGFASYSTSKRYNVLLNYVSNPKDYLPYIVSDTIGKGIVNSNNYTVNGNFSFNAKNWHYGIGFYYRGIVSSKLTDPRFSTYSSELKFNLGAMKKIKNKIYSIRIFPQFDRQNISVKNFNQLSRRYYQFYGFGEWNRRESKSGYNYSCLMTIKGIGLDMLHSNLAKSEKPFRYLLNFSYKINKTNTLEPTNKNLFSSVNQYFNYNVLFQIQYKKFDFHFLLNGNNKWQMGTEHIYKNKKVSEKQQLYDYVKVASNQMYNKDLLLNTFVFKTIYKLPASSFHTLIGLNSFYYNEKYAFPSKQIRNINLSPFIGAAYHSHFKKNQIYLGTKFSYQNSLNTIFDLDFNQGQIFVQQAYIPFLIRSQNNYAFHSDLNYIYSLKKKRNIGFQLSVSFTNAMNLSNIHYPLENMIYQNFQGKIKTFFIF